MTRPTVYDDIPNPFFEGDPMPPAFEDIPTFTEFQKERESKRNLLFALLAMTLYTSLKITGLVCATLIMFSGLEDALYIGGLLFVLTLAVQFEFNPAHKAKKEQPHVTK